MLLQTCLATWPVHAEPVGFEKEGLNESPLSKFNHSPKKGCSQLQPTVQSVIVGKVLAQKELIYLVTGLYQTWTNSTWKTFFLFKKKKKIKGKLYSWSLKFWISLVFWSFKFKNITRTSHLNFRYYWFNIYHCF